MTLLKTIVNLVFDLYHMLMAGESLSALKLRYHVEFGHYFHQSKELNRARAHYEKAAALEPADFNAQAGLSEVCIAKQLYYEALEHAQKAMASSPKNLPASVRATGDLNVAIIYEALGKTQLADEAFKRRLAFDGGNLEYAYYHLSERHLRFDNYSKAEHYCKEALKLQPDGVYLHDHLARIYWRQNNLVDAKKEFERILQITSNKRNRKWATRAVKYLNSRIKKSALETP